jgi:hypothetical protein
MHFNDFNRAARQIGVFNGFDAQIGTAPVTVTHYLGYTPKVVIPVPWGTTALAGTNEVRVHSVNSTAVVLVNDLAGAGTPTYRVFVG